MPCVDVLAAAIALPRSNMHRSRSSLCPRDFSNQISTCRAAACAQSCRVFLKETVAPTYQDAWSALIPRSLRVQGCWQLGDSQISSFLHRVASLEELDAGGLMHLGDAGISGLWGGQLPALPWRSAVDMGEGARPPGQQDPAVAELPLHPVDHNWRPCECR